MKFKILAAILATFAINCFAFVPQDVLDKYFALTDNGRYKEAIDLMLPYAQQKDDDAELKVGYAYIEGLKNYKDGMMWYKRSADRGNAVAKSNLAGIYYHMFDYKQAFKLYEQADKQDYAPAAYMLGVIYYDEREEIRIGRDYKKAVEYFKKAADLGYAESQYMLGICYINSHGVAQDMNKAKSLLKTAAKNGSKRAEEKLRSLGW